MEELQLLKSMAIVLGIALGAGLIAHRLRLPIVLGYLVSGIIIGPNVLGLVEDVDEVETLATIGVVLLMFAVGVEFSLKTLRRVGALNIFGGIVQVIGTGSLGFGIALTLGFSYPENVLFGFFVSLSSTIVVLKTLADRGELGSPHGRIMTAILLIQDLSVVILMAVLPALENTGIAMLESIGWAVLEAVLFLVGVFVLGFWALPRFMKEVAGGRSRELFLLMVVCLCLGTSFAAYYLGLSLALGAFLAGLLMSESEYAYQALADIRPLRDIFAVLFFGSLGMLADPGFVADHPVEVGVTVVAVIVGKTVITALIPWLLGYGPKTTLFVGASLFQIGEFSFVIAALALEEDIISDDLYALTLATAFFTILLTPFSMSLVSRLYYRVVQSRSLDPALVDPVEEERVELSGHVVICGFGRVARHLGRVLDHRGFKYLVIDLDPRVIDWAREKNIPCIFGDASHPEVLARANLTKAKVLVIAFPDPIAARLVVQNALRVNRRLDIIARVYGDEEAAILREYGVSEVIRPDLEAGFEIIRHTLHRFGLGSQEILYIVNKMRSES